MRRKWVFSILALIGICLSMTTASAMHSSVVRGAVASHSCCPTGDDDVKPDEQQAPSGCCGGGSCIAACCRVISTAPQSSHEILDASPAIATAATWSIVAFSLTDPDSIFRPPRQ